MISVAEAISIITSSINPVSTELVEASSALGRVLAEDVASQLTHPPTDVSAMDGYAVRIEDIDHVPAKLTVIGESAAGSALESTVGNLQAARISTGAAIPRGANSVVIQEDTLRSGNELTILKKPEAKKWIREAGLDFRTGQTLLKAGRYLTARDVGLAAAMNVPWVRVFRKPRVAFLATGNEVVLPGSRLGPNQIISSNSAALAASISALGGVPVNVGIARDTESALETKLQNLEGIDLLITIGGASVGDHDLVLSVLTRLGFRTLFQKVAMRPGKPMLFGLLEATPVFGLPGNPVSVGVATAVFLRPAMQRMSGVEQQDFPLPTAWLTEDLSSNDSRQDYVRARFLYTAAEDFAVTPLPKQDSSMLAAFADADCLIVRAPHAPPAMAGDRVHYVSLAHSNISL